MLKLIILTVYILANMASPTGISFTPNKKYSFVGRITINIPSLILNTGQTNWHISPAQTIITFQRPIQSLSGMKSFATISDLQMQNLNQGIEIFIDQYSNITQTQMTMHVYAGNANNIKRLSIFYMYFYKDSEYSTNVQLFRSDYFFNYGLGRAISSNPSTTFYLTLALGSQVNVTDGTKVITYISGTQMSPSNFSTLTYDISIAGSILNSTAILLTFSSKSSIPTYVYQVYTRIIIYNPSFLSSNASTYIQISSGAITTSIFSSDAVEITNFNTIIGLTSFSISQRNAFNFTTSIDNSSVTFGTTLRSYFFTYFTIYSNYCHYKTPYYQQVNQQCWDVCPGQTTSNSTSLTCLCFINSTLTNNTNCLLANTQTSGVSSSNSSTPIIIGIVAGIVVLVLAAGGMYYFICLKKCCKKNQDQASKQVQIQKGQKYMDDSLCGTHKDQIGIKHNYKKANEPQFELKKYESQIRVQNKLSEIIKEDIRIELKKPEFHPHIDNVQTEKP